MTIGEVSKKYSISLDTLRYYEKVGLIKTIKKEKGIRSYKKEDLDRLEFIICMRSADMPIKKLLNYLTLFEKGDRNGIKRREILVQQQKEIGKKIEEFQTAYNKLTYKIELYDKNKLEEKLYE